MTEEITVPPEVTDPDVQAIGYTLEESITCVYRGERKKFHEGEEVAGTLCDPGQYTVADIYDHWWDLGGYPALQDEDSGTVYCPVPADKVGESEEQIFWIKAAVEVSE
jgi:hypothetical protein